VAAGQTYAQAARASGHRSYQAISQLVSRFNQEGLPAIARRPGGGAPPRYGTAAQARILARARQAPDPEQDGTATWSVSTSNAPCGGKARGWSRSAVSRSG